MEKKGDRQACMQVGRQTPTSTPTPTPNPTPTPIPSPAHMGPWGALCPYGPIRIHIHTYIYVSMYSTPKRFAR